MSEQYVFTNSGAHAAADAGVGIVAGVELINMICHEHAASAQRNDRLSVAQSGAVPPIAGAADGSRAFACAGEQTCTR
jgi:hypothetical protein